MKNCDYTFIKCPDLDTGQKFDRQYEVELKRARIKHPAKLVESSGKRYSRITI